jgi:hypothetical protein
MGRFRIIGTKSHTTVCISRHIDRRRQFLQSRLGLTSIVLAASVAYFAPVAAGAAPARAGPPAGAVKTAEMGQYHGLEAPQYHHVGRTSAPLSASLSRSRELANSISARVISRLFTSHSPNSTSKVMIQTSVRSNHRISAPNDRSIGRQIGSGNGSDPRLMIRIGATLGLVYLAFLAVWFWATRFRMRPSSSAPS